MAQIPLLAKIFCDLPLFMKYLAIYHCFVTRVHETRFLHITRVLQNRVSQKYAIVAPADLTFLIEKSTCKSSL